MPTILIFAAVLAALVASKGIAGWRWYPSRLAMLLMLPLLGLLLWRLFPELLFIPIVIPLFWNWRRRPSSSPRDHTVIDLPYPAGDQR